MVADSIPFPLLFAEDVPSRFLRSDASFDITEKLAELTAPAGPTGKRDKVLILSNRKDLHADRVAIELVRREVPVCRFHTEELLDSCLVSMYLGEHDESLGTLELPSGDLVLEEVRSVCFRRPELPICGSGLYRLTGVMGTTEAVDFVARETEAALYNLFGLLHDAFWISNPNQLDAADHKLVNLKLAKSVGLLIPRTIVTNDPSRVRAFYESCHGNVIVKTFCGLTGASDGNGRAIFASPVLPEHLDKVHLVKHVPCLFQEYVPKDVELRVTIVGRQLFATEIHSQLSPISRHDWRRYDLSNTPYYPCSLPASVERGCREILSHYGLVFGAIDMIRRPDGAYVFLELNANGQWLWIQQLTGLPIAEAIADLLARGSID
jgi:glutathione synthase/RimK-type ligase-like ATP-grasp enzyme